MDRRKLKHTLRRAQYRLFPSTKPKPLTPADATQGITIGLRQSFEQQSLKSHAYTTSTFGLAMEQETERVRGVGSGQYNPDVQPYQHWLLKMTNLSPFTAWYRERLLLGSNLLRTVTEDQIIDIVSDGWEYDPPQTGTDEWDADRITSFVEAMSKALVINSGFLTIWSDGSYRIFTTNDVYKPVYLNKDHKITEIYFKYPSITGGVSEDNEKSFTMMPVGFLTQYAEEETRPARMAVRFKDFKMPDTLYRECVIIQPKPSIHDLFGYSKMQIECDTAVQKVYLRSYEFAFLHKGGVNKTLAIPDNVDVSVKDTAVKEAARGLWSRGLILFTKGNKNPNDQVFSTETAIPPLFFGEISNLLSEDQQLSKQKAEGAADSGALGGQAPIVNKEEDKENLSSLINTLERTIRDINFVFDGVPSDEIIEVNGRKKRKPTYRVKFNQTQLMTPEEYEASKMENSDDIPPDDKPIDKNLAKAPTATAHSVSISDDYVTYRGNLFAPGVYSYPESNTTDIFTPSDIQRFTENPVNKAPIELSHSNNYKQVGLENNLGYLEVIGYDTKAKTDITNIHIKRTEDAKLRAQGIIVNDTVKLSPYFHDKLDPVTKHKHIYNLNAALLDPRKEIPRGELTGLKTEAHKVN